MDCYQVHMELKKLNLLKVLHFYEQNIINFTSVSAWNCTRNLESVKPSYDNHYTTKTPNWLLAIIHTYDVKVKIITVRLNEIKHLIDQEGFIKFENFILSKFSWLKFITIASYLYSSSTPVPMVHMSFWGLSSIIRHNEV